jgi:hypothetical protein
MTLQSNTHPGMTLPLRVPLVRVPERCHRMSWIIMSTFDKRKAFRASEIIYIPRLNKSATYGHHPQGTLLLLSSSCGIGIDLES